MIDRDPAIGGLPAEPDLMSRRTLLTRAVALAGAGFLSVELMDGCGSGSSNGGGPETDRDHFPQTFENADAEAVASELHINPASYYVVGADTLHAMADGEFIHRTSLVPTFSPGVRRYERQLTAAAEAADIPVNFLAAITTIESAGNSEVRSGADAWGLEQVVPMYHLDGFVQNGYLPQRASYDDYLKASAGEKSAVSLSDYQEAFLNPEASLTVGAQYLRTCLEAARSNQPGLYPDSPVIYAWAASAYNGGIALTQGDYSRMPQQSQLYANHVIRMLMDVEIAARLAKQGMSDNDVVKALWSNQMNARAYAYGQLTGVANYNSRARLLTTPVPGVKPGEHSPQSTDAKLAYRAYEGYLHGKAHIQTDDHRYSIPAPPGIRIWLEGGGIGLFASVPENANWRSP